MTNQSQEEYLEECERQKRLTENKLLHDTYFRGDGQASPASADAPNCSICGAQLHMGCCHVEVKQDIEAYRQQVSIDVFHSLVHGIRLHQRPDEDTKLFAMRVFTVHEELMGWATYKGIIPSLEPTK